MIEYIPIINKTLDLSDCAEHWFFDETYRCWCLEDVLYTLKATTPKFQRLSIFVPQAYLNADGTIASGGTMGLFSAKTLRWSLRTTPQAICRCPIPGWAAHGTKLPSTLLEAWSM